jgi:hypothetical protein
MDCPIFVSAREHAQGFDIVAALPNEPLENFTGPFPCAATGESQSLQLSQSDVTGKFLQATTKNVISEQRLSALEHSLAEKLIERDWPRLVRLIVRAPDTNQRAGFDPALPELLQNCLGIAPCDSGLFSASY